MQLSRRTLDGFMLAKLLTWPSAFCSIMVVRLNPPNPTGRGLLWRLNLFQTGHLPAGKSIRLRDL